MLSEEQIRVVIVQLAQPLVQRAGNFDQLDCTPDVIGGLAWALLGHEPNSPRLTNVVHLQVFLEKECGIPCKWVKVRSHVEWRWDETWMKARGLSPEQPEEKR
jgi:hypothetical protein